jgi:tetratricopeptide (TPR) repeat protein
LIKREETRKTVLFPAGLVFLAILSFLTWQQCGYWKNSIVLFEHALQITKNVDLAHYNLGVALSGKGRNNEAIYHYNKAISIKPAFANAYNNRGNSYDELGQHQQAIEDYNKAIDLDPNNIKIYNNRGRAYLILDSKKLGCLDAQKVCELGNCELLELAKSKGDCR